MGKISYTLKKTDESIISFLSRKSVTWIVKVTDYSANLNWEITTFSGRKGIRHSTKGRVSHSTYLSLK